MAEVMNSLFGITPESLMADRESKLQAQAMRYAEMDPFQRATAGIYKGASQLGGAIGGMLGAQDPEMQKAAALQGILKQADTTTPEGLATLAQTLGSQGFGQQAMQVMDKAQAMKLTGAKISAEEALAQQRVREKASADPFQQFLRSSVGKVTPESLALYKESQNPADLDWIEKPNQTEIAKLQAYRNTLPKGSTDRAEVDAVIKSAGEGKGTKITNVLPGIAKAGDVTGLRKDLQAITKPYQDQSDAAKDAIDLANMALKENNFAAVSSLSRSLAKAAGETQLSRNDVEAFGIDPSLVGRVSDTVSTLAQSRPTVDTLTKLRQLAEALKKKADSRIDIEEQQLQETARVSGQFTEPQITTVFRRRPAASKTEFTSIKDAEAANLPKGTRITINGRQAVVE